MMKPFLAAITICAVAACASAPGEGETHSPYILVAEAADAAMRAHHYDPGELDTSAYRATQARVAVLARTAESKEDFTEGFNAIWRQQGPFSHVNLQVSRSSANDLAAYLDTMRLGGEGARLTWERDIAVLTVTTMMGADTIEQIDAAYDEIAARGARALILDLRENAGGAFAVRPLVGHVIAAPLDAGAFVSRRWAEEMDRAPTAGDVAGVAPWEGWSLTAFWRDVEAARITRLQFTPMAPHFAGPVFVLIGSQTASAAELAADAFAASGRATLIGRRTAGRMLSQKPYDLPEGLQLFLPIADYYAFRTGRIEGRGVAPHVEADNAMAEALARAMR